MKRTKYSLSHYRISSGVMGHLIPLTWYEVLPGDTVQHATAMMIRLAPLLAPLMHPIKMRIHHWFVPNRLIWEDWEDFITGGEDGLQVPVHPYFDQATDLTTAESSLKPHMGIPPLDYTGGANIHLNVLPFRAYGLIYNEHYRDQQINAETAMSLASGADVTTTMNIRSVAWEKDYFTVSRPYAELGDAISIPVTGAGDPTFDYTGRTNSKLKIANATDDVLGLEGNATGDSALTWNQPELNVDIDEMRLALGLRRYQQARNLYGARYVEYLRHLGVRSSDGRLGNPEFLGGGAAPMNVSEVIRTGNIDADASNVGDMHGHGIGGARTRRFRRYFEEHGIVMSLLSVVPKSIYGNQLDRGWFRQDKEDYYQKELADIGEQAVFNKEVHATHAQPDATFGYQSRYDEYRSKQSTVTGEFHTTNKDWHMARIWGADPALNTGFVSCAPDRTVFADSTTDNIYIMANHSIQARRIVKRPGMARTI